MNTLKIKLWLLWLAFLGGLLITGLGIWQIIDHSGLFADGEVVQARVVDTIPADAQHPSPTPVLQWSDEKGSIHRMTAPEAVGLTNGDSVEVLFEPLDPASSRIRSLQAVPGSSFLPVLAGIALCLIAAVRLRR